MSLGITSNEFAEFVAFLTSLSFQIPCFQQDLRQDQPITFSSRKSSGGHSRDASFRNRKQEPNRYELVPAPVPPKMAARMYGSIRVTMSEVRDVPVTTNTLHLHPAGQ